MTNQTNSYRFDSDMSSINKLNYERSKIMSKENDKKFYDKASSDRQKAIMKHKLAIKMADMARKQIAQDNDIDWLTSILDTGDYTTESLEMVITEKQESIELVKGIINCARARLRELGIDPDTRKELKI